MPIKKTEFFTMSRAAEESESKERVKAEIPWKSVGIGVVVWSIIGFLFAFEFYLSNYKSIKFISFWDVIGGFLREISFYAVFTPLLLKFGSAYPFEFQISVKRFFRNFFIHLVAAFFFAIICFFLQYFVYGITRGEICLDCFKLEVLLNPNYVHRGVIVYWGIILVGQGVEYFRRLNDEKVRVAQLSTQLSEAQLSALKMQLHPHFLFNTLNSIASLLHKDAETAHRMIARLSDFLRMTLKNSETQSVSLDKELEFLDTYLEIEKIRFQERLEVEMRIEPEALAAQVPNLILQPIVENAVRHGLANVASTGRLKISAGRVDNRVFIQIEDNGPGLNGRRKRKTGGSGVGLANTRARLEQFYGADFSFEIAEKAESRGTIVSLEVPFKSR